jgi:hypothetical protein
MIRFMRWNINGLTDEMWNSFKDKIKTNFTDLEATIIDFFEKGDCLFVKYETKDRQTTILVETIFMQTYRFADWLPPECSDNLKSSPSITFGEPWSNDGNN